MGNLKVSVILNSYNRPKMIVDAINSVKNQTYDNWELLIIDDSSNKETIEAIKESIKDNDRCILLRSGVQEQDRNKTTRYATCINIGLQSASGELITYLTDDDIYYPQRLEKMVESFSNPEISLVYDRQRVVRFNSCGTTELYIRNLIGITNSHRCEIDHNSIMHRKSCLEKTGPWDDNACNWGAGDAAFFITLNKYYSFYPVDYIGDEHRLWDDSIQGRMTRGMNPF